MAEKNELALWQEHAWKYFELHANQRISLFRFYIAIFIFFISSMGFLFIRFYKEGVLSEIAAFSSSILFIGLTVIFQLLDCRNRKLIHFGEDALRGIESNYNAPAINKLFTRENQNFTHIKHTNCFHALYGIAYGAAVIVLITSILSFLYSWPNLLHFICMIVP